jgi:hypothetical protein
MRMAPITDDRRFVTMVLFAIGGLAAFVVADEPLPESGDAEPPPVAAPAERHDGGTILFGWGDTPAPAWMYDAPRPSPGFVSGGVIDPFSLRRHHGLGEGNHHQLGGVFRHHGPGHAYYDWPACETPAVYRFHGLGDGGAYRKGFAQLAPQRFWWRAYEPGPIDDSAHQCEPAPAIQPPAVPVMPRPAPAAPRDETPADIWVRVPDRETGAVTRSIPLRLVDREPWDLIADGRPKRARTIFAMQAIRDPGDGMCRVGYAIASAMAGTHRKAVFSMREALRLDPEALAALRIDPGLALRLDELATVYDVPTNQLEGIETERDRLVILVALHQLRGDREAAIAALAPLEQAEPAIAGTLERIIAESSSQRRVRLVHAEDPAQD